MKLSIFVLCLSSICACNSPNGARFADQQERCVLSLTTSSFTANGAASIDGEADEMFRCPAVSGMGNETNLTVFRARSNALLPHFTLDSANGIRSDSSGGVAVSLSDVPLGLLDVYMRCNRTSSERYTTSCPASYAIVEECSDASANAKECVLVYEGIYDLVVSATADDSSNCMSEETDRSPYISTSIPDIAYACDSFSSREVAAAYRGDSPSDNCCAPTDVSRLDFCIKPCGCRKLTVKFVPKQKAFDDKLISDRLRIAVFSNVSSHEDSLNDLLDSIGQKEVDMVMSLGNLTASGSRKEYKDLRTAFENALIIRDGNIEGQECTTNEEKQICCDSTGRKGRYLSNLCNSVFSKKPFLVGLGNDEYLGNISSYNDQFGVSNVSTFVGKLQLILLDTADGSLNSQQRDWLKEQISSPDQPKCNIPAPSGRDQWPSLYECRSILGLSDSPTDNVTCRQCIGQEAYCIPPDASRSKPEVGPENCICVPKSSDICPNNMWCSKIDGTDGKCLCTRDEDCGIGGTCQEDGSCTEPMRLVFSYTPPFDDSGIRNNAFTSKSQAASLLKLLAKANVSALFSGHSADYSKFSMAGIPIYNTGGGGSAMTSFSDYGHHWLYVEIPNVYTAPSADNMKVEVVEF